MKQSWVLVLVSGILMGCNDSASTGNVTLKGAGSSASAAAVLLPNLDPTEMNIKVYKFAVSASTDCSNPITIYENESPTAENFLGNPTIGSGSLNDGSYPCVIMEISDNMTFKPATSEGNCTAGTSYTIDVCRSDSGGTSTLIDGSTTTCTGTNMDGSHVYGDDRVAVYMSTSGTTEGEAFRPDSPLPLTAAFTVNGSTVATFVADGSGQVESLSDGCDMGAPAFGFE